MMINVISNLIIVAMSVMVFFYSIGAVNIIEEGHIGVYYRGGRLLDYFNDPGLYFQIPFLTKMQQVQINIKSDTIHHLSCLTKAGVHLYFPKVKVINSLKKSYVLSLIH